MGGDYSEAICENRVMATEKKISYPSVSSLPDADMQAAPRALLRAAQRERDCGSGNAHVLGIVVNGVLTHVPWDQIEDIEFPPEDEK